MNDSSATVASLKQVCSCDFFVYYMYTIVSRACV